MKTKKIQKSYIDYGLGFPVQILDAPLVNIHGEWTLDLNLEKYERDIFFVLALKSVRLSGNEIKFIRHHLEMDLKSFGKRFGEVTHAAVIKWEKSGDSPTHMNWAIEKDIRLFIVNKVKPKVFLTAYSQFQEVTLPRKAHRMKISCLKNPQGISLTSPVVHLNLPRTQKTG